MAAFEFIAKHPMNLGGNNQIMRGERFTMNIHTVGVQPFSVFSNPESRRQAIQQFAINGIDVKSREYLLNTGHWEVKRLPDHNFSKAVDVRESVGQSSDVKSTSLELPKTHDVIDDVEMKKECIGIVKEFYGKELDLTFADKGLEGRCEIATDFYKEVKQSMGIDAELSFVPKSPNELGGYNPKTNCIELNSNYLEKADCEDLLNTILHESRHAFQGKCIQSPESVTVKNNVIDVWKDNFQNYISPCHDFEAYENQEIEKDANYYADSVMKKGMDVNYA